MMVLKQSIVGFYIHIKTTYNPAETLIALSEHPFISVTYRLINGKGIGVGCDKSGVFDLQSEF